MSARLEVYKPAQLRLGAETPSNRQPGHEVIRLSVRCYDYAGNCDGNAFLGKKAEHASHLLPGHGHVATTRLPKEPPQPHRRQYGVLLKHIVVCGGATEDVVRELQRSAMKTVRVSALHRIQLSSISLAYWVAHESS